jgi:hypothetical protein
MAYKYFLYSELQINEKNNILSRSGKEFVPGIVTVNGRRVKFTQLSDSPAMPRYIDTKIVAQGELEEMTVVNPTTCLKAKK